MKTINAYQNKLYTEVKFNVTKLYTAQLKKMKCYLVYEYRRQVNESSVNYLYKTDIYMRRLTISNTLLVNFQLRNNMLIIYVLNKNYS